MVAAAACIILAACGGAGTERPGPAVTADAKLRVAAAAEASGNRDMAASMYASASDAAPDSSAIQRQAAEGLARNGKLDDAQALLARRLQAAPADLDLREAVGGIAILKGQPDQAVKILSEVLASKPADSRALVNTAVALDILGRHSEAQPLYRRALLASPDDLTVSNDLALSLMLSGRLDEARQVLEPFRDNAGLPERVQVNLAILDATTGRQDLSESVLGTHLKAADIAAIVEAIRQGPLVTPRLR